MSAETQPAAPPRAGFIIKLAWNSVLTAMRTMPLIFVSAAVLSVLLGLGGRWLEVAILGAIKSGALHKCWGLSGFLVFLVVQVVLHALVLAPVAVAIHRLIILDETTRGVISLAAERVWKFTFWTLGVGCLGILIGIPGALLSGTGGTIVVLLVGLGIVVTCVRLALIFPAVAIEAPSGNWRDRIEASWEQTRGRFWLIAISLIGTIIPFVIAILIPAMLLLVVLLAVEMATGGGADTYAGLLITVTGFEDMLNDLTKPVSIALVAAVASWIYMWVMENQAGAQISTARQE